MVDLLILNYNDCLTTMKLVERVNNYSSVSHVLVVDNKSTDNSFEMLRDLRKYPKVFVLQCERNGGYGAGNNYGIKYCVRHFKSENILLCNPDVIIEESVITELENFIKRNTEYALVAPVMLDSKGRKQKMSAFKLLPIFDYIMSSEVLFSKFFQPLYYVNLFDDAKEYVDVDCLHGSLFMMNVNKMLEYGMFDEKIFLYGEETVLGFKMKQSHQKLALMLNCSYVHNHSVSISKSIRTPLKRRKILLHSHLLVIKEYYKAGWMWTLYAKIVFILCLVETFLISFVKK